jgi:hypothetical protein
MWASRILFANAIWDLLTGLCTLVYVVTGRLKPIADLHTDLWICEEDRNNSASIVFVGCLVLQWSWMRLITAIDPVNHWQDAVYTYWLEGMLVGVAAFAGRMHARAGCVVVLLCAVCAAIVLGEAHA